MYISIIIPNYNGADLISKNIPRLIKVVSDFQKSTGKPVEIIIVDDCSLDSSDAVIRSLVEKFENEKVRLLSLKTETNTGFSGTINLGAKNAKGELLILLNSDAYPEDDFISPSLSYFNKENVYGVGFMDKSIEGEKIVLRGRGVGRWERGFLLHKRGEVDSNKTLWVNGGSCVVRKKIWDRLGGMDQLYNPFYWEDIDISYRAQKSGYKVYFETKSIIVHEHEKGAIVKTFTPDQVKVIAYRNQVLFSWLNLTDISLVVSHLLWLPYHILRALLRGDHLFIAGFTKALILLPKVIQSRNRRKRFYSLSDKEIIKEVSG